MKLLVFTGAGMSAESGLRTFREGDGLWEEHSVEEVATPQAWERDPDMVNRFYNERRRQLLQVQPNKAHYYLAELEAQVDMQIVTQNVDNLHERAGSHRVLHLHGELMKCRCEVEEDQIFELDEEHYELDENSRSPAGHRLRPHVVWFGEAVPAYAEAAALSQQAEAMLVIGSSLQVYPAAGLLMEIPSTAPIAFLDPGPNPMTGMLDIHHIQKKATEGLEDVNDWLRMLGLI